MIERVAAPWGGIVLVCRKCSKKVGGGFGPEGGEKLGKALRRGLRARGRRRALRVVEVGCLGLCPKRAVTVVGPGEPPALLAVARGTAVEDVLEALGVPPEGAASL